VTVCIEDTARCVYGATAAGPASDSGYRRHDIVSAVTIGYHHTQCQATLARCTSHLVVGALSGYKNGKVRRRGKLKRVHGRFTFSLNVAFYPIGWVESHIHLIASTTTTGILGHNAQEIALQGPIRR
jgi:hypothetical protein